MFLKEFFEKVNYVKKKSSRRQQHEISKYAELLRETLAELYPLAKCDHSQLKAATSSEHVTKVGLDSRTLGRLQASTSHHSISHGLSMQALDSLVKVGLATTAVLVPPWQAILTEDLISTHSCKTVSTGVLIRLLQQVQIHARHQNFGPSYVPMEVFLIHP